MSKNSDAAEMVAAIAVIIGAMFLIAGLFAFAICVYGLGVWLVWNYALVPLAGMEPISFWLSCAIGLGLSIVSSATLGKIRSRG